MKKKKIIIIAVIGILCFCIIVFCKKYFINETSKIDNQIIKNCKLYLWKHSPMDFVRVDFQHISVRKASEDDYKQSEPIRKDTKAVEGDLVLEIGNTQGHNFRILLVDSESKKVVGKIPIK